MVDDDASKGDDRPGISVGRRDDEGEASDVDPFELVANEVRAEIVRTLGRFAYEEGSRATLAFSDLRSRSDVDVVSSQFNYHLQRLVGQFVEKTDDGYRLRPEGKTLYRTIRAGTFGDRETLSGVAVGVDCYHCGSPIEVAYDDGMFTVHCESCETLYDLIVAPPGTVGSDEDLLYRLDQYNRHLRVAFARGVCPTCMNGLDTEFVRPEDTGFADSVRRDVYVYRSCDHCGNHSYLSVGSALLHHPALIAFCYERGLDLTTTPRWELEFAATDRHVTVRSTDPWEVSLSVSVDGDTLKLVVDGDLSVVDREVG